jgi:hypothetical protein
MHVLMTVEKVYGMKRILKLFICLGTLNGGILFAQHSIHRPIPAPQVMRPHEIPHENNKRRELSKKLIERKNELRREDRGRDQRNREVKPRSRY